MLNGDQSFSDSLPANGDHDENMIFYGISYPKSLSLDSSQTDSVPQVLTNYEEVQAFIKKNRLCRFNRFKSKEDALKFAQMPAEQILSPVATAINMRKGTGEDVEKGSTFRSPRPQDFVKLRLSIEKGDEECFKQTVWANPRYLIGNADNPTIFHEGCRYNALHVIAKSKQTGMCRLLLETIENPEFMKLMYPDDKPMDRSKKIKYLVDFYLNMRDRGSNETPLHMAAKFGAVEIVAILVSHPNCEKSLKNKYGETAREIALSRCTATSELKHAMDEAFEEKYFVDIKGSTDDASPPYVSGPIPVSAVHEGSDYEKIDVSRSSSPFAIPIVRARAGPMSPSQAKKFCYEFKSNNRLSQPSLNRSIKLSDLDKGYERIGRCTAKKMNIEWKETWPFGFCDVSNTSGLNLLEEYLKSKIGELSPQVQIRLDFENVPSSTPSPSSANQNLSMESDLCQRMNRLQLKSPVESSLTNRELNDFICRSCRDLSRQLARELRDFIEYNKFIDYQALIDLLPSFECIRNNVKPVDPNQLHTIHKLIAELIALDLDTSANRIMTQTPYINVDWLDVSDNVLNVWKQIDCIFSQVLAITSNENPNPCRCNWDDIPNEEIKEETFFTPPSSPCGSPCSSPSDEEYQSPTGISVFMNGNAPTKQDLDVLRALE